MHGSEYAYSISDPFYGQSQLITKIHNTKGVKSHFDERGVFFVNGKANYVMSKGSLEINLRIQNSGDLPLDILSVEVDHDLDLSHLRMFHEGIFLHGKELPVRFSFQSGQHITLLAADFRAFPRSITHEFSVDAIDADNNRGTYISEIETSSRPLIDLYVKLWREYDQEEYLVLAGYSLKSEN